MTVRGGRSGWLAGWLTFGAVGAGLAAAPAPPWPAELSYGSGPWQPKQVEKLPEAKLSPMLLTYLQFYALSELVRLGDGNARSVVWSSKDKATNALSGLNRAEKFGLITALQNRPMGLEADILVAQAGGAIPVTVYWDVKDVVSFKAGPPMAAVTAVPDAKTIQATYGVGEFKDQGGRWDAASLGVVSKTLSLMSREELALLKDLPFYRQKVSGSHRALYSRGDEEPRVNVFDACFVLDGEAFMGDPATPVTDSVGVLLHELGHALADLRMREISRQSLAAQADFKRLQAEGGPASDARLKAANALTMRLTTIDQQNASKGGRPVEREFAGVLAFKNAPTHYGRKNTTEAFAESYRLFKADPEALKRAAPKAHAWFATGTYLATSARSLD